GVGRSRAGRRGRLAAGVQRVPAFQVPPLRRHHPRTAAGFGVARFVRPQYGAQATIWIDATERERWGQGQDRGPIRQGQLLDPQAWVDLLKSYVVLDQVVRDQRLFVSPESRADEPLV